MPSIESYTTVCAAGSTALREDVMPGKRVARPPRRRNRTRAVAAVIAGLLVAGVIAWVSYLNADDDDSTTSAHTGGSGSADSGGGSTSAHTPGKGDEAAAATKELRKCAHAVARAERAVSMARVGVGHWRAHVLARTDWLSGRISEKKMNAIWDRTRAAGPGDVKRFHTARQHYHEEPRCTKRHEFKAVPRSKHALVTGCIARSVFAPRAVAAAKATIVDWKNHLKHMNTYANGGMTAGKAQRLWVRAWRKAPENIGAFKAAGAKLHHAPHCPHRR
jgi:hypothetical protein